MSYRIFLIEEHSPDGGTHWLALHPDLPGCHAVGRTQQEAKEELAEARESWMRIADNHGGTVPPEQEFEDVKVLYLVTEHAAQGVPARQAEDQHTFPVHV